jgi:hypothetical protein
MAFLSENARVLWPKAGPVVRRQTVIALARSLMSAAPRARKRSAVHPDIAAASLRGRWPKLARMIQVGAVGGPAIGWKSELVKFFGRRSLPDFAGRFADAHWISMKPAKDTERRRQRPRGGHAHSGAPSMTTKTPELAIDETITLDINGSRRGSGSVPCELGSAPADRPARAGFSTAARSQEIPTASGSRAQLSRRLLGTTRMRECPG